MIDVKSLAFESPPIWELGISVGRPDAGWFNPYDIREVHDLFRARFPTAERQQPFAGFQPFPTPNTPVPPQTIQIGLPTDLNRWWFVDDAGSNLIQVQENFIARNWRRLSLSPAHLPSYPGFDAVYEDFHKIVASLGNWSSKRGDNFGEPTVCELMYENLIPKTRPDGGIVPTSEIITPLQFDPPIKSAQMNISWFECVDASNEIGALDFHININAINTPNPDGGGLLSFVKMSFIARSVCSNWNDAFKFIELSHLNIRKRLVELTTESARSTWGPS